METEDGERQREREMARREEGERGPGRLQRRQASPAKVGGINPCIISGEDHFKSQLGAF